MMYLRLSKGMILKKVVAPVAMMAPKAIIRFDHDGLSLKASEPDSEIMVVLRLNSKIFNQYLAVMEKDPVAEISTRDLDATLASVGEGPVYITTNNNDERLLEFTFNGPIVDGGHPIYAFRKIRRSMRLNNVIDKSQMMDDMQYEFKSTVGIPSAEFCGILTYLSFFGRLVDVSITNNQLTLSAMNQERVLTTENGECAISGVAQYDQIQFSFGLEHIAAFMAASVLSSTVWILTPALPESPLVLQCFVGEPDMQLGDITFFFPSKMIKIRENRPRYLNLFPD